MNRRMAACAAALAIVTVTGCGKPTAKDVLDKSTAAYKNAKSLAIDSENSFMFNTGGQWQGSGAETVTKYKKPNKISIETPGRPTLIADGKKGMFYSSQQKEYIEVPADVVMQNLNSDQSSANLLGPALEKDGFKSAKNPKLLEDEQVGGVDTYVVEFTSGRKFTTPGLDKAKITEKVWIGKDDYLARKREVIAVVPKEVIRQQNPADKNAQAATLTFSAEAKKIVLDGNIADSAFKAPKGAKKVTPPSPQHPPMGAPPAGR